MLRTKHLFSSLVEIKIKRRLKFNVVELVSWVMNIE